MDVQNPKFLSHDSTKEFKNKEEIDHSLHTLNKVKLKPLLNYLWTDLENVLVDMSCEFKTDTQKKFRNGFLIITYGGVYIFKNKFLVSPPPTFILTLLECQTVTCDDISSTIAMSFADFGVEIKVKEALKIIYIMAKIVAECTYGLEQYLILPRFQIKKNNNETIEKDKSEDHKSKSQSDINIESSDDSINSSPSSQKQDKNSSSTPKRSQENNSNSPSNQKQSKNSNDSDKKQNKDDSQNVKLLESELRSNVQYCRSESNFFYCGSDEMNDVFERIHLSTIATTRPKNALFNRCLFLAHFYNIFGHRLGDGCKYMAKYDEDPSDILTIGPHFMPGKFALSYGHAIGWETNLTKVMFYHFKPMYFGQLLESLLINSVTINQICFIGYKFSDKTLSEIKHEVSKETRRKSLKHSKKSKGGVFDEEESGDENDCFFDRRQKNPKEYYDHFLYTSTNSKSHSKSPIYIPDFSFNKVTSTKVTSFWFHECDYPVIASFFEELEDYICPIDEFEITLCNFTTTQLEKIFKNMTNLECFRQLRTLALLKNNVKRFQIDFFNQFINVMSNLETIDISESELDGSKLFATLCTSHSPVKSVKLSNLKFHTLDNMSTLSIPPTLIHADFSKSSFSPQSFKDILLLFTNKKTKEVMQNCSKVTVELANSESAVMLCMAGIKMKQEGYEVFNTLDFSTLSDNIYEFDWSENKLPPNCINSFFKFLETQKKMRILILNSIILEKQKYFFKRLTKYVMSQKLPGLDMRAKLYRKYGLSFYESLKKATFLRKLGVVIRNGSDEVMNKFSELIRVLPMLTECKADGFLPHTKESLINLWTNIINHPTICATDLPHVDTLYLEKKHGIKIDDIEFIDMMKNLESVRKPPSNMLQRTAFTLAQIRSRNENIENNNSNIKNETDFFVASCSTPWIDSTPHSRLENLQNSHNFDDQEMMAPLIDNCNNDNEENSPLNNTKEDEDESALLLNICNGNNENETYCMQCIPDDLQSNGIAPTQMPDYGPDENDNNDAETEEVEIVKDDEFDDQNVEIEDDETESNTENEDE